MPTIAGTPTSTSGVAASPAAFSYNFPGGSRPFVGCFIGYYDAGGATITSVEYGGVALTQLATFGTITGNGLTRLYGLVGGSVPTGANNMVVTVSAALDDYVIQAFGATDVDQTTPSTALGTVGAESASATATTALTGSLDASDWLLAGAYIYGNNPTVSDTEILETAYGSGAYGTTQYSTDGTCNWTFATSAYVEVGVILNHSSAIIDQEGFRWGVDDGSESAHTWEAAQDTNISIAVGSRLLRVLLDATGDPASAAYTLRVQKNGTGGYIAVPVGASVAESYDTITFGAIGTGANGSTTVAPTYPTGITSGQYLVAVITSGATNSETPTAPDGTWTQLATGASTDGTYGVDTGPRRVTAFGRLADGTETGTVTFSITNGGTCRGTISRFSRSGTGTWQVTGQGANDSTSGTGVSMTFASMNWNTGDATLVAVGQRVDGATQSAQSLTASGVTFGALTNRATNAVTTGNDHRHVVDTFAAVTGTSNVDAAPTWAYTASAAVSAGGVVVRLRAYTAAATNEAYISTSANIASTGEDTTARLIAPGVKTTGDFVTGRRWDAENGTDSIDITTDDYTEVEWSLTIQSPAAASDYYEFRVYSGASELSPYTVTPRWTIPGGATGYLIAQMFVPNNVLLRM